MIDKIDFESGNFKWYIDKHFKCYIENKQAENLPKLSGIGCFIVKNGDIEDHVLIDDKQNIIDTQRYTLEGFGHIEAKINIIKISKYYDEIEGINV